MKLKDIIVDEDVKIYELNKAIQSPTMYGAILYKGNARLLKPEMLEKDVFRLFECGLETHIIVY